MINAKIKCPYCQAVNPVDYKNKFCGCIVCHQTIRIHKAEVVVAPKDEIIYDSGYDENGNKYPSVKSSAFLALLTGTFGIDFFVHHKPLHGFLSKVFCWTGATFVLAIFRFLEIMALEPDEIDDYYNKFSSKNKRIKESIQDIKEERKKEIEEENNKIK